MASSLLTDLLAWWSYEKAGSQNDSHGSNALTNIGSVPIVVGKIGNAIDIDVAVNQQLECPAANLPSGNISFTVAAWVKLETKTGTRSVISRDVATREWAVIYSSGSDRFSFDTFNPAGTYRGAVVANTFGSPSVGVWYLVIVWHDATNLIKGISVNNVADTASYSTGVANGTSELRVGQHFSSRMDGLIDETAIWTRALTSAERTELYNGGAGLTYADIAPAASSRPVISSPYLIGDLR